MLDFLNAALAGRYRIDHEIGQGGMATVYLAHDIRHDRMVALKVLNLDLDPMLAGERFEREIRFAARLHHPHILTVLDSGSIALDASVARLSPLAARLLFYSMPYIDGETLRARLVREPQLPIAAAIGIAQAAAEAVQHAHAQGIIHRDIKPENILISKDGNVLVTDFGIARALDSDPGRGLTRTGTSVGTPVYMSPEQAAADERVDVRTDVYSLGVVLYEMLAGEPPYTGTSAQAVMMKRISLPVPSLRVLRPRASRGLDQMVQEALAPSPGDRTPTAAAFLAGLDRARQELTDPAAAAVGSARGWKRYLPALGVAAVALAGFIFLTRLNHFPGSEQRGPARPPRPARLVVLPFENLGDTSERYFADGLTDEVRGKLTTLPSLEVIARASSMQYGKRDKSPGAIANELGVRYLLTGTVRSVRNADGTSSVQVRPELVEVTADGNGQSRWQQSFDAPLTDVFRIQSSIADSVARALSLALPPSSNAPAPTSSPEAWDAYLRARAAWNNGASTAPAAVRRARVLYQRAIALDSNFASAWGGVSLTSVYLHANSVPTPALKEEARAALQRMRELDPDGIETHVIGSRYLTLVELDNKAGVEEARAALRRSPHDALLLGAMSAAERSLGEWDSSLVHAQAAYDLDPRTASRAGALSQVYLWTPPAARGTGRRRPCVGAFARHPELCPAPGQWCRWRKATSQARGRSWRRRPRCNRRTSRRT